MKAKIEQLQTLAWATDFLKWLPEEAKKNLLTALLEESKEKADKIPEKSDDTWEIKTEKATIWNGKGYEVKDVVIKINPERDIKEFVSWVPDELIGEQFFSRAARRRLCLSHRIPANILVIERMINEQPWKDDDEKYAKFYKKYIKNNKKNNLAGWWDQIARAFKGVNIWICYWVEDDSYAYFNENNKDYGDVNIHEDNFLSVRLLKE